VAEPGSGNANGNEQLGMGGFFCHFVSHVGSAVSDSNKLETLAV